MSFASLAGSLRFQLGQRAFLVACLTVPAAIAALVLAQPLPEGARPIVLLFPIAVAIVVATRATSRPYRFTNRLLKDRIINLEDMFARATRSVVILTGSLNAALYSHQRVVGALRDLPAHIAVKVIYTGDALDMNSRAFTEALRARGNSVLLQAKGVSVRHSVVIDEKDTKLEEPSVHDHEEEKCADYYYDNRSVARAILSEIDDLQVAPGQYPN